MPSTDFRAFMAKLKDDEESKAISSNDRYLYFKKALPEKIHLIHQSLKKSMKKSKPDELNLEEKRELLSAQYEDIQTTMQVERDKKANLK